jgi:protein-tyrosine phosphatase
VIDLHCHILPGIDDGPADLAGSLAMARQAEADGIERVCATPHIRHDHDVRIHDLAARVAEVNAELRRDGAGTIVLSGGELAETRAGDLDDDELEAITLGGAGRWLLLEPAPGPVGHSLVETVDQLATRGYRSLVAHPERHLGADYLAILIALRDHRALIQLTADTLVRGDAADAMLGLAERGLCHVLGTDSHSAEFGRPVRLSEGLGRLATIPALAQHMDWIAREAPAAIVNGRDVQPPY